METTIDFLMNLIIFPAPFSCVVHSKSIVVPLSALLDVQLFAIQWLIRGGECPPLEIASLQSFNTKSLRMHQKQS